MTNKIMKIVFALLLIVLIGELFYLFYSNKTAIEPQIAIPTLVAKSTFSSEQTLKNIDYLKSKGAVTSSYVTNEYLGVITKLVDRDIEPPFKENPSYRPILSIRFQPRDNKKYSFSFYFDQDEMSNLLIKKTNGAGVSYKELKNDTDVVIKEKFDIIKNSKPNYEIIIL